MSTDELFASLGGSLMKDLWADLQGGGEDDDIGFSLEQLERELANLDDGGGQATTGSGARASAANLVVSHQGTLLPAASNFPNNDDAWQLSLEKFTSMGSLEQDFLAADTAKKQSVVRPPGFLAEAEDYDVTETAPTTSMLAPPGMSQGGSMGTFLGHKPVVGAPTPDNSMAELPPIDDDEPDVPPPIPHRSAPTPHNSVAAIPQEQLPAQSPPPQRGAPPPQSQQNAWAGQPPPMQQQHPGMMHPGMMAGMQFSQGMPPQGMPPQGMSRQGMPPQGMPPQGMPPQAMPMGIPVPQMMKQGKPWQSPPQPQVAAVPQVRLFCQVHPNAPPVPAAALESSLMKSRDLAYIIHSMLKPILLAGVSPSDYDMRLMQRGAKAGGSPKKDAATAKRESLGKEMTSRREKTNKWMKDKNALGHVTKTDVSRPRALLATPTMVSEQDHGQKQRASLWKARLYIDQGYKATNSLVEIWQRFPPGTVPPEIQPHLTRLFKVLGINVKDGVYSMDPTKNSLECILKLSKGRTFLVRLLEQALLPPKAAQVLIPAAITNALAVSSATDVTDSRLFTSMGRLLSTMPNLDKSCMVACVKAASRKEALTSQSRMGCIHVLLRRGNGEASVNEEFAGEWKDVEQAFMKLLG